MFNLVLFLAHITLAVSFARAAAPSTSQYALQWTKLTITCRQALTTVIDGTSDFSKCSGAGDLFDKLLSKSAVDSNASVVPYVEQWLEGTLCSTDQCSFNATNSIAQKVTDGCAMDIGSGSIIALAAQGALLNYGGARRTLCLIDSGVNGNQSAYCPLEILNNVKSAGMEISYGSIKQLVQNPMENLKKLVNTTLCQPCGKGAVAGLINLLNNLDGAWATSVADTIDQYCGANFADGTTPAELGDGAKTTTTFGPAAPSTSAPSSSSASSTSSNPGGTASAGDASQGGESAATLPASQTPDGSNASSHPAQPLFQLLALLAFSSLFVMLA